MELIIQTMQNEHHNEEYFAFVNLNQENAKLLQKKLALFKEVKLQNGDMVSMKFESNMPVFYEKHNEYSFEEELSDKQNLELDRFDELFELLGEVGFILRTSVKLPGLYTEKDEDEEEESLQPAIDTMYLYVKEDGFGWSTFLHNTDVDVETHLVPWDILQQIL